LRSKRSATTPPRRENTPIGPMRAKPTSPAFAGEPVSASVSSA
jgi:hypothetical protein